MHILAELRYARGMAAGHHMNINNIASLAILLGSVGVLSLAASGCGVKQIPAQLIEDANRVDGSVSIDDATIIDATTVDAALGAWSAPARVVPAAEAALSEDDASLSPDELEMTFAIVVGAEKQLSRIKRATTASAWGPVTSLNIQIAARTDQTPRYAKDGLTLYFASNRNGTEDIFTMTRTTTASAWSAPTPLTEVNTAARERWFAPCDGGRYLLISDRTTVDNLDVYEGTLGGGAPTRLASFSSATNETGAFLSFNCKHAFFATTVGTTLGVMESFWIANAWTTPTPVLEINTATFGEQDPWLSNDGKRMMFVSNALGTNDVYMMTRM